MTRTTDSTEPAELQRGLKQRHLTMIAIGGVIGAGLFVGSGVVINETGPAAFLSYVVAAERGGDRRSGALRRPGAAVVAQESVVRG